MAENNYEPGKSYTDLRGLNIPSVQGKGILDNPFDNFFLPGLGITLTGKTREAKARELLTPEIVQQTGLSANDMADVWDPKQMVERIETAKNRQLPMSYALESQRRERRDEKGFERTERSTERKEMQRFQDQQQQQIFAQQNQQQERQFAQQKDIMAMSGDTLEGKKQLARMQMKNNIITQMLGKKYI